MLHMYLGSQFASVILNHAEYFNFLIRRILKTTVTLHFSASWNHRISEVERDPQQSSTLPPWPSQGYLKLNHVTKCIIQMLLELWQVWWHDHFLGESIPVINHSLGEGFFPNVQHELVLALLHSISSYPKNKLVSMVSSSFMYLQLKEWVKKKRTNYLWIPWGLEV